MDIEAIRAALRPFVEQTEALSAEIDGYFDADKDPPRDLYYKLADLDTEMVAIVLPHVTPPTLEACDAIIDLLPDGVDPEGVLPGIKQPFGPPVGVGGGFWSIPPGDEFLPPGGREPVQSIEDRG